MDYELILIMALSAALLAAWFWITHVVFTEGAQIRRAKRDAELAALKLSGQDKNRRMDIHV